MLVINWHLFAHRRLTIANGCCNSQWKACAFDVCVADCCSYSANDFPQTAFVVESESSSALSSVVIFRLQRFLFRFTEVASRILFGPGFGSGGVLKVTIVPSFGIGLDPQLLLILCESSCRVLVNGRGVALSALVLGHLLVLGSLGVSLGCVLESLEVRLGVFGGAWLRFVALACLCLLGETLGRYGLWHSLYGRI